MNGFRFLVAVQATCFACLTVLQADADDIVIETLHSGLQNPRGVAVRRVESADHDEVFVAESGANQVIKLRSNQPDKSSVAISGFAAETTGERSGGPLALEFVDSEQLVVGCGSSPVLRVYKLANDDQPLAADMPGQQLNGDKVFSVASICRTQANEKVLDLLIVSCRGQDPKNWLASIPVRAGMIDKLSPFAAMIDFSDDERPIALAVSPQGFVVVSSRSRQEPQVGRLTFINPIQASPVMELVVTLADINGLGFSPKTGNLFATAATPNDVNANGLFRIDDASVAGKPGCKAVKVADVADPAALAFAADGTIYVTASDESASGDSKNGILLRIHGDL